MHKKKRGKENEKQDESGACAWHSGVAPYFSTLSFYLKKHCTSLHDLAPFSELQQQRSATLWAGKVYKDHSQSKKNLVKLCERPSDISATTDTALKFENVCTPNVYVEIRFLCLYCILLLLNYWSHCLPVLRVSFLRKSTILILDDSFRRCWKQIMSK